MAAVTTSRRPSPLQRRVLIVLAALDAKRPGPVATRDIERVLEQGGDAPVYGPNLRASCRRMEAAGWLRTLRAPNLQLAVELTDAGSSPHVWGCVFITCERIWLYPVFPTCVEVFSPFK